MNLHDIPIEISDGSTKDGIYISTDFMNALRAFKYTFRYRDVQILVENGKVIGAGCSRDLDYEEPIVGGEYAEVEVSWLLWPDAYGNWLNVFNMDQHVRDFPAFSWDWITRIRHVDS